MNKFWSYVRPFHYTQEIAMYKRIVSVCILICCSFVALADQNKDIEAIQARLEKVAPQDKPDSIKSSAVEGIYEVIYGSEIFYLTGDGRHVFQGTLIDLETNINLTENAKSSTRKTVLNELNEESMIVFSPEKPRHTLTIFTDIDCGYCRKLHAEMDQINSYGIKVRYMMFPRSGVNTPSYQKAVNVWCAKDQLTAMTKAKAGESVPRTACDNPVEMQMLKGQELGVTGTPALFLEDGTLVPGYRPAKDLAAMLDSSKTANPQ